jgi:hypothetical protein
MRVLPPEYRQGCHGFFEQKQAKAAKKGQKWRNVCSERGELELAMLAVVRFVNQLARCRTAIIQMA